MKHRITRYLLAAVMAVAACTVTSCDEEVIIEDYDPVITFTPSAIKFTGSQAIDFPSLNSYPPNHRYWYIEAPDWVEFSFYKENDHFYGFYGDSSRFLSAKRWNEFHSTSGNPSPHYIRCTSDTPGLSGTVKVTWVYPLPDGKELRWYGEFTVEC